MLFSLRRGGGVMSRKPRLKDQIDALLRGPAPAEQGDPDAFDGQHDAKQLENGHLLVFDNGLRRRRDSRVFELNAATGEIVWRYEHEGFYTNLRGGAQQQQ